MIVGRAKQHDSIQKEAESDVHEHEAASDGGEGRDVCATDGS